MRRRRGGTSEQWFITSLEEDMKNFPSVNASCLKWSLKGDFYLTHSLTLYCLSNTGLREACSLSLGTKGKRQDINLIQHRAQASTCSHTMANLEWPISLNSMSLDCRRKLLHPKNLEKHVGNIYLSSVKFLQQRQHVPNVLMFSW